MQRTVLRASANARVNDSSKGGAIEIGLLTLILTAVSALGAMVAAVAAALSAREMRLSSEGQLFSALYAEYWYRKCYSHLASSDNGSQTVARHLRSMETSF